MKNHFVKPKWVPRVEDGMKILITGATGGLGRALVKMLLSGSNCIIGAHGSSQVLQQEDKRVFNISGTFQTDDDCCKIVDEFIGIV